VSDLELAWTVWNAAFSIVAMGVLAWAEVI